MKDNRGTTVLLTVIGIATLLVAVVGATFAYFTAQVEGTDTDTDVTLEAANLGVVTFEHSEYIDLCDEENADLTFEEGAQCIIYPGASETKKFTISHNAESTDSVDYIVYLVTETNSLGEGITNETENLVATLTAPTGATSELNATPLKIATYNASAGKVAIGSGTLNAGEDTHEWSLNVQLLDNGLQNDDQGRQFTAKLVVEAGTKWTSDGAQGRTEYTTTTANAGA